MQAYALTVEPEVFKRNHDNITLDTDNIGFKTAINILDIWGFSDQEKATVLGDIPIATFRRYKKFGMQNRLTTDRRTRLSLILGIHKALKIMFLQEGHRYQWVNNTNRAFGDMSPKSVMLSGSIVNLNDIRRYLDAARG